MRDLIDLVKTPLMESDYRGQHQAPNRESGAPLYDLTDNEIYPDDVYGPRGYHYAYDDRGAYYKCMEYRGRPNKIITIYRSVPKSLVRPKITRGDWVAITREYARQHGESNLNNDFKIIKMTCAARDVFTDGDSLEEWGYDPQPYMSYAQEDAIREKLGMETKTAARARIAAQKAAETPQASVNEGDVVDFAAAKRARTPASFKFSDALIGIRDQMRKEYQGRKFLPMAEAYIESGLDPDLRPKIGAIVSGRDYRPTDTAKRTFLDLRKAGWTIHSGGKPRDAAARKRWIENANGDQLGAYATIDSLPPLEAEKLFSDRNLPDQIERLGGYAVSPGWGTGTEPDWSDTGLTWSLQVKGLDGDNGKYDTHTIDDDQDMAEFKAALAMIHMAEMGGLKAV